MSADRPSRVFVAGHKGMVGSAIIRRLSSEPGLEVLTRDRGALDLSNGSKVEAWFKDASVDAVYLAAAKVGGILANRDYPADFITENLQIQTSVISAAHGAGIQRLLFLGSSCIYPRQVAQPMSESALMTGTLEPTNEAYAVAKIAGIKMCEAYHRQHGRDYRSVMPTNLYGPNDNFDLESSHVLPALLRKFHQARQDGSNTVEIWGSGQPRREFLHVDDMADACVHVMNLSETAYWSAGGPHESQVNVGTGEDIRIAELADLIAEITGYRGSIQYDRSRPDGTPRKLLNVSRLENLGWSSRIDLRDGIEATYHWMVEHLNLI